MYAHPIRKLFSLDFSLERFAPTGPHLVPSDANRYREGYGGRAYPPSVSVFPDIYDIAQSMREDHRFERGSVRCSRTVCAGYSCGHAIFS